MPKKTDARLLVDALKLDAEYGRAADFDSEQFNRWVEASAALFCKRTDFPKLGYIIHLFNEAGIPSVLHHRSFHADHCLWVQKGKESEAWAILSKRYHGKRSLDDVRDDAPSFRPYADTRPDPDLWDIA